MEMKRLLEIAAESNASDLHLVVGAPPTLRIDGELIAMEFEKLAHDDTKQMIYSILNSMQIQKFEQELELDFSFTLQGVSRFRANLYVSKGNIEAAFRVVALRVHTPDELGIPKVVQSLCVKQTGLVLVTGPTGVGKTTTLNSLIDLINREQACRIITIEDPVEYIHQHRKSIVIQREVYADTKSFATALIHALRQDPNVICVGEMRDLETISTALTAAETGHLVLATLHTPDAIQTIDRIIDVFPPYQQDQIRMELSSSLLGIVAQQLLPRLNAKGRIMACEVLIATPAVRNVIRERKIEQISTIIQTSKDIGMRTMDNSLKDLYLEGAISYEEALARVKDIDNFKSLIPKGDNQGK